MSIFHRNMAATTQLPMVGKHVGNCGAKAKISLVLVSIPPITFGWLTIGGLLNKYSTCGTLGNMTGFTRILVFYIVRKEAAEKKQKTMVLWCTGSMSVVVLGDSSEVSSDHNYDITPVKYWGKTLNCEGHRLQQCMIGVANVLHGWQLHCDRCFFFTNSFNLFEASWFLLAMFTSGDMLHSQQNMFCQINISPGLSSQRRGSSVSGCAKPPQPSKIDMLGSCGKNDFNTMGQHYLWPWR